MVEGGFRSTADRGRPIDRADLVTLRAPAPRDDGTTVPVSRYSASTRELTL